MGGCAHVSLKVRRKSALNAAAAVVLSSGEVVVGVVVAVVVHVVVAGGWVHVPLKVHREGAIDQL